MSDEIYSPEAIKALTEPPCVGYLKKHWKPKRGDWVFDPRRNRSRVVCYLIRGAALCSTALCVDDELVPEFECWRFLETSGYQWLPSLYDLIKPGGLLMSMDEGIIVDTKSVCGLTLQVQDAAPAGSSLASIFVAYRENTQFFDTGDDILLACAQALRWLLETKNAHAR